MSLEQALLIGVLAGTGTYLVLHRTLTRIILGLVVLGNAVNLLILASGDGPGEAPIVGREGDFTDPVPQALVLTAIVIGFGVISFLLAMAYRSWTIAGNDEVEDDIADRRLAQQQHSSDEADDDANAGTGPDGDPEGAP